MSQAPILEGHSSSLETQRMAALFDELEKKQAEFLDEAGRRIIQLCTTLIGVVFAVTAFGDKFPPPYLKNDSLAKGVLIGALILYLTAIGFSLIAIDPREYSRYTANITAMREVLTSIVRYKRRWLRFASVAFTLGSIALVTLVALIILWV